MTCFFPKIRILCGRNWGDVSMWVFEVSVFTKVFCCFCAVFSFKCLLNQSQTNDG